MGRSVRELGLEVVRTSGGEELLCCPLHDDRSPSAWYNPKKELFYCAVCNKGLTYRQLAYALGFPVEDEEWVLEEEPTDYDLTSDSEVLDIGIPMFGSNYYMVGRNITAPISSHYGVRWKPSNPSAVVLPLTTPNDATVGVCYRYVDAEAAGTRYRKVGKTTPLWPMHLLPSVVENDIVIVAEGAFSAMRLASFVLASKYAEPGNFFSLLGAKATQEVVDVLAPYRPIILYDNDEAGRNACRKMRRLAPHYHSFVLPKAPDDMVDEEIPVLFGKIGRKMGL